MVRLFIIVSTQFFDYKSTTFFAHMQAREDFFVKKKLF